MGNMSLLLRKIKESGITVTAVARKTQISRETLYNRLAGKSEFRASEIARLSELLRLNSKEKENIFFD